MASITKGVTLSSSSPIGLKGIGIILLIVVGFTVVPEFINLGSTKTDKDITKADKKLTAVKKAVEAPTAEAVLAKQQPETAKVAQTDTDAAPPVTSGRDTLAKIATLLDQGYLDRLRDQKVKAMLAERPEEAEIPVSESTDTNAKPAAAAEPQVIGGKYEASTLTWKVIKAAPIKTYFVTAQKEAMALAKSIEPGKRLTKMALLDYVTGIANLMKNGDGLINAPDVPAYVARLERDVAGAMKSESVDRESVAKFAKAVVSPNFTENGVSPRRPGVPAAPAFNPRLTIISAQVSQKSGLRGRYDPRGQATVKLAGYVIGKDIKQISIIKNGLFFKVIKPGKPDTIIGQRQFKLGGLDARANYIFVVENKDGQEFKKSYSFLEPAKEFQWRHKGPTGADQYQIPYYEGDHRFDMLFATHRVGDSRTRHGDEATRMPAGMERINFGGLVAF